MSVLQQPVCRQPLAVSAGLGRLLCRFDFRQKVWGLAVVEFRRDFDPLFPDDSAALVVALSRKFAEFPHPSLGVAKSATSIRAGFESGIDAHSSPKNFVTRKGEGNEPLSSTRISNLKETARGRRNFSAARVAKLPANFKI